MKKKKVQQDYNFETKEIKKSKMLNDDYKKALAFIIILIIIIGLFALLFFLNGRFVTKDYFGAKTTTSRPAVTIDLSLTTVDDMFKISDKKYYVLLFNQENKNDSILFNELVSNYDDEDISLYTVDLASPMNNKYYNESGKENSKPKSASEVVVTKPTLILFENGKVKDYISDKEKILEKFAL